MAKTERIYIRVTEEMKKDLQRAAEKENRTLTNYIENVIKQELEDKNMKSVYFVFDAMRDGSMLPYDDLIGTRATMEEGIELLKYDWNHMTDKEKKKYSASCYEAKIPKEIELDEAFDYVCDNNIYMDPIKEY